MNGDITVMRWSYITRASVPDEQPLGRERTVAIIQISGGQHPELCWDWCMNKPISAKVKVKFHDTNPIRDLPIMHPICKFCDPSFNPTKVILRKCPFCAALKSFDPK